MIDSNTFVGAFPFRHIADPSPAELLSELDREGIEEAWVGHLPSAFYRDPTPGNVELFAALRPFSDRLRPVPTIRPDWPNWRDELKLAIEKDAAAIRAYPPQWQMGPHNPQMAELALACGKANLPVVLTVRFEDLRQRHPHDVASDLSAAHIRYLARVGDDVRILVTAAGKDMIEEAHWSLTPREQQRIVWDISWTWGPPDDHLAKLFRRIGPERFVYGSQWPLRLSQNPRANLDLLPGDLSHATMADPNKLFDNGPA